MMEALISFNRNSLCKYQLFSKTDILVHIPQENSEANGTNVKAVSKLLKFFHVPAIIIQPGVYFHTDGE